MLWNLKLIIRFPPGATILMPSALVTHSNIPIQKNEKRYVMLQYSAGALARWVYNGYKSDKAFVATATSKQKVQREEDRKMRWKTSLASFSRWEDVRKGDWKGERKEEEVEEVLSDLTDLDEEAPPLKRSRRS